MHTHKKIEIVEMNPERLIEIGEKDKKLLIYILILKSIKNNCYGYSSINRETIKLK